MASPGTSGEPAGAVGASTPLPPEADLRSTRRSWGTNVREVGSDAELREALVESGTQTVSASAHPAASSAPFDSRVSAGCCGLQRSLV
jgi:hypothetical protein